MLTDKWEPEYGNASHPGLLADGPELTQKSEFISTHKEDFLWPKYSQGPIARRKQLVHKSLFNEITEKHVRKMMGVDEEKKMEKYSSYQEAFKGDGFDVRDILESADPKKMAKYPLYSDQAYSIYFDKIKNIKQKTVSNDPKACFRKCSYFSKPFYAELEE